MKLHIPSKLRAALLAALAMFSYTIAPAYADGAAGEETPPVYEHTEPWTTRITTAQTLDSYETIEITGSTDGANGGAVYAGQQNVSMTNSGTVIMSENGVSSNGGAVYNGGYTFTLEGDEDITIGNNTALNGGAIYQYNGTTNIRGNGDVSFAGNTASSGSGGAIYQGNGTTNINGNESVSFVGNTASSGSGGAIYQSSGTTNIKENGKVTFSGNTAKWYGAIGLNYGPLNIVGNDEVVFEKNFSTNSKKLIGLTISYGTTTLSAAEGQSITFYDTLCDSQLNNSYGLRLKLNDSFTGLDGNTVSATGDIVFSGKYTEEHLAEAFAANGITGAPTAAQILASRTSEIDKAALYAGRLIVEDSAVLSVHNLTVNASDATVGGTTVRLDNGSLKVTDVTFASGTVLELKGGETTLSGTFTMGDGSTLRFLDAETKVHSGTLQGSGTLNVDLQGDGYAMDGRSVELLRTNGISNSLIVNSSQPVYRIGNSLMTGALVWQNGTGNSTWDAASANWQGGNIYADGLDVYFGDAGAGSVTVAGDITPGNVVFGNGEGNDYSLSGGSIGGVFSKSGTGTVTLGSDNAFSSATIFGGKVAVRSAGALGSGAVALQGGTLDLGGLAVTNTVTASGGKISGASAYNGDMTLSGTVGVEGALHANNLTLSSYTFKAADNEDFGGFSAGTLVLDGATLTGGNGVKLFSDTNTFCSVLHNSNINKKNKISGWDTELTFSRENGRAINNQGYLTFSDNTGKISISGNTSTGNGAAIYATGNTQFRQNGDISIDNNSGTSGGAIYCSSNSSDYNVRFDANGDISLSGNTASGSGGAYYGSGFGASLTFQHNGDIAICGNTASKNGGAIYSSYLYFQGNGDVVLRQNFETENRALRSFSGGTLELDTLSGKSVSVYDSVSAGSLELNKDYYRQTGDSGYQKCSGTIRFSGKYTEEDLAAAFAANGITDAPTEAQILASRTSEFSTTAKLYGGHLVVEDGAVLQGTAINSSLTVSASTVTEGGTTVHLDNGSLIIPTISFASGTVLDLAGANSITGTVTMAADSTISMKLDDAGFNTAILDLNGSISHDALNLKLDFAEGCGYWSRTFKLISLVDTSVLGFDLSNVSVTGTSGASESNLRWEDGILYLDYDAYVPRSVTWTNASGDSLWNERSLNWQEDGNPFPYTDRSMSVHFGDAGAGTVTLEGGYLPNAVVVDSSQDYTFTGEGGLNGEMTLTKDGTGTLRIETANTYSGGTVINEGTVEAGDKDAFGTGDVTLKGGTLDMDGNAVENNVLAEGGTLAGMGNHQGVLRVEGEVSLEGDAHIKEGRVHNPDGKLTIGDITITVSEGKSSGTLIQNCNVSQSDGYVRLQNDDVSWWAHVIETHIDVAEGCTLELENVFIGVNSRITDAPATVLLNNVAVHLKEGLNSTYSVQKTTSAITLSDRAMEDTFTMRSGVNMLDLTSYTFNSVTLDGSNLEIRLYDFDLTNIDLLRLSFGSGDLAATFATDTLLGITAIIIEEDYKIQATYTGMYSESDPNSTYFVINRKTSSGDVVPEPATATLSLLALAALAARRRRKITK